MAESSARKLIGFFLASYAALLVGLLLIEAVAFWFAIEINLTYFFVAFGALDAIAVMIFSARLVEIEEHRELRDRPELRVTKARVRVLDGNDMYLVDFVVVNSGTRDTAVERVEFQVASVTFTARAIHKAGFSTLDAPDWSVPSGARVVFTCRVPRTEFHSDVGPVMLRIRPVIGDSTETPVEIKGPVSAQTVRALSGPADDL